MRLALVDLDLREAVGQTAGVLVAWRPALRTAIAPMALSGSEAPSSML
jgi:hypothetical protein